MKTIKDAYKALNGDLQNSYFPMPNTDQGLYYSKLRGYLCSSSTGSNDGVGQYICTIEEFNNYKGDEVKTILDAVIELKADLNNTYSHQKSDNYLFYEADEATPYVCLMDNGECRGLEYICDIEDFNELVAKLSTNFGRSTQTYIEYKKEFEYMTTPTDNEAVKPEYTQEMCDAGELPTEGAEIVAHIYKRSNNPHWIKAKFIGKAKSANEGYSLLVKSKDGVTHVIEGESGIKPLAPQKTDEEMAIEEACFIIYNTKRCADTNTNIDCSAAQKAVIITLIKNGYTKPATSIGE